MDVVIRPVESNDLVDLWRLMESMGHTDSPEQVIERAAHFSWQDTHFLPVAIVDGRTVGYTWAQDYGPHLRSGERTARLHDLCVDTAMRRRGVGRQLLNAVIAWAETRGVKWLQWQSSADAVPFYERLGYKGETCPDPTHPFFEITF